MGSLLDAQRARSAQRQVSPARQAEATAVEEQKQAIKYGEGAAGEELAAATAEDVKKQGQNMLVTLRSAGVTSGREWERAAKMSVQGYDPEVVEAPFLAKAGESLSWLDKLGATVRFGIGDILQLDQKAGTEFDGQDFKDIWGGNWQSIAARHGADIVGEEGRYGGQAMLESAGWKLEAKEGTVTNWLKRNTHGLAALVVELGTDPLSYVAPGAAAVGKRASVSATHMLAQMAAGRSKVMLEKGLLGRLGAKEIDNVITHAYEREIMDRIAVVADDLVAAEVNAGAALGEEAVVGQARRLELLDQAVAKVVAEEIVDSGGKVARREFSTLSDSFTSYAKENDKAFLQGGVRITAKPLGQGGWLIPGTPGKGRAVTRAVFGTPVDSTAERGFLGREVNAALGSGLRGALDRAPGIRATTRWRDLMSGLGEEHAVLRGIAEGREEAARQFVLRAEANSLLSQVGTKKMAKRLTKAGDSLNAAMRRANMSEEEGQELFKQMMGAASTDSRLFGAQVSYADEGVQAAAETFQSEWRVVFDEMHEVATKIGLPIGKLDNYVPLVKSKQLINVFEQMESRAIGVVIPEGLSQAERHGYELLSEMYAAWLRRGKGGGTKVLGEAREAERRLAGRSVAFQDMGDSTLIEFLDGSKSEVIFPNHADMNVSLSNAVADVANRNRVPIGKNFAALESNPYKLAERYFNSMNEAIAERMLINEARKVGLIKGGDFVYDLGRMISNFEEQLKTVPPGVRKKLEAKLVKAQRGAVALQAAVDAGLPVGPLVKPKYVKQLVGGHEFWIDEDVLAHPRVQKALKSADRLAAQRNVTDARAASSVRVRMNELIDQGYNQEVAKALAEADEFSYVAAVREAVLTTERENHLVTVAAQSEYLARVVAGEKDALALLKVTRQAELETAQAAVAARKKAGEAAIARAKAKAGLRPVSSVRFETARETAAFGQQMKPVVLAKFERMAEQADNLPGLEAVATKLREMKSALDEITTYSPQAVEKMNALMLEAGDMFKIATQGQKMRMSMAEWVQSRPKRYRKMGFKEQQRVMDEWAEYGIDAIPPVPPAGSYRQQPLDSKLGGDDAAMLARDEAWFEAVNETIGVDLRQLNAADRKHLRTLLAPMPTDASGFAAHDAARAKILGIETGRALATAQKRTVQHMFLDVVEDVQAAGGKLPAWAQIDVKVARLLEPDEFAADFGWAWGLGAENDKRLKGVWDSIQLLYSDGFLGKELDEALMVSLAEDFELLASLQAGRGPYRDNRLATIMDRMFEESAMSDEFTIRGTRGGRVVLDSKEHVERLTTNQLNRELRLLGYVDDIEGAAKALVDGTLDPSALSPAARTTLGSLPKADMEAIDGLAKALKEADAIARVDPTVAAQLEVKDHVAALAVHKRLEAALAKVSSVDGIMTPKAIADARQILSDPVQMKRLRKLLPVDQHPRLDAIRDMVDGHEFMRAADSRVKGLIRDSRKLRQSTMFDPQKAMDTIKEATDEIAAMRTEEALAGYQGTIDIFDELVKVIRELNGLAPDVRTGNYRSLWATDLELDRIDELAAEGERYARQLGFDKVGNVLRDVKQGGVVPTAESSNFLPAAGFGLGGEGVTGKLIEKDLGVFIQQTVRTMMAAQTPVGLSAYTRGLRQVMHWWKGMATVARPTFHIRNAMSAMWNNTMVDVRMQDYKFVARHTPKLRSLFRETGDWVEAARRMDDPMASYMFEQAALAGLFDSTFSNQEILKKLAREQATGRNWQKVNPLSSQGPLITGGGIAMENIEDFFRLAAFVRHMPNELIGSTDAKMLSAAAGYANDMVNMVHFDYKNLTAVEERIKDFIPFFVWTRRNLPLQMKALVEQPRLVARYNHMIHVGNDMSDSQDEGPRKYGGQMFIGTDMVMNPDTPFWAKLIFDPDIPVKDLFEIESPLNPMSYLNLVTGMLGPQIQEPMKMAFQDPYQTTAPAGWSGITRLFAAALDGNADLDTNPRIDSRVASIMKLAFPPASEFLTAFEKDPVRMQRQGIVEGDVGTRVRAGLMDLTLPGLGFQTQTPASSYSVYQSSMFSGQDALSEMRKRGIITAETDEAADLIKAQLNP